MFRHSKKQREREERVPHNSAQLNCKIPRWHTKTIKTTFILTLVLIMTSKTYFTFFSILLDMSEILFIMLN